MSPERKEPNATWQYSSDLSWDDSNEEGLPLSYEQDEEAAFYSDQSAFPEDGDIEEDEQAKPEPFYTNTEALRQFGQQLSPILAPLLFGALTFLFLLPLMRTNHFYLHMERLWPIGLVLVAVAILQGMMLYYAGANNVYWSLGIVAGFFLFLLVGCFVLFGPLPTLIVLVVMLIGSFITARICMRPVPEGSVDLVYSFGKYSRTHYKGLNFVLPWEWIDTHLDTRERHWTCPEQTVPVSLDEELSFKATISYQLVPEDAYLAVTQTENWEEKLQDYFKVVLQYAAPQLTADDFLVWGQRSRSRSHANGEMAEEARWDYLNTILFEHMRDRAAQWGVEMKEVKIRDITLTPRASLSSTTKPVFVGDAAQQQPAQASPRRMGSDTGGRVETPQRAAAPPANPITIKPPPDSATPPPAAAPAKRPNEAVLINAYKQIQAKVITSPEAIRKVAEGFLAIANDSEANKNVNFDAGLAAERLFEQARLYEEQEKAASVAPQYANEAQFSDETPMPPWSFRPPTDDNLTLGG